MLRSGCINERPKIAFGHIVLLLTFELKGSSSDLVTCIGTGRKRRERERERERKGKGNERKEKGKSKEKKEKREKVKSCVRKREPGAATLQGGTSH